MTSETAHHGRRADSPRAATVEIDRRIGARIRERRVLLGLTLRDLAELVGISSRQAHKYERGTNRVPAGRLPGIARALGVGPGHFLEGLEGDEPTERRRQSRAMLELARHFAAIRNARHRDAIRALARTLAEEADAEAGSGAKIVPFR